MLTASRKEKKSEFHRLQQSNLLIRLLIKSKKTRQSFVENISPVTRRIMVYFDREARTDEIPIARASRCNHRVRGNSCPSLIISMCQTMSLTLKCFEQITELFDGFVFALFNFSKSTHFFRHVQDDYLRDRVWYEDLYQAVNFWCCCLLQSIKQ